MVDFLAQKDHFFFIAYITIPPSSFLIGLSYFLFGFVQCFMYEPTEDVEWLRFVGALCMVLGLHYTAHIKTKNVTHNSQKSLFSEVENF